MNGGGYRRSFFFLSSFDLYFYIPVSLTANFTHHLAHQQGIKSKTIWGRKELSTVWCKAFQATCPRHLFYFFAWEKNILSSTSALTGGHRDRNDHSIMEYCSEQFCNTLTVFKFQRLVSLRNSEALLPPLHTAAELIKTLTFNKTPHYHKNIKPAKKKKKKALGQAAHASRMSVCVDSHSKDSLSRCGSSRFPDANHAARLRDIVCILHGPWHLLPLSSADLFVCRFVWSWYKN